MEFEKESRELTLSVPWGHISALAWGSPQNDPVILVHGTLDNAGSFSRLVQLLPENYYYVAIDLPGHGKSTHFSPGTNLNFFNYILTIKYVLDQLQWSKCLYMGHSLGAQFGIIFSIIFPGKLTKIIAFDGLLPRLVPDEDLLDRIKVVNDSVLNALNDQKIRLYTKDEVLDALQNRRRFKLNREAALALFDRSVTMVGDKYKYNRDARMKSFICPTFNLNQYAELMKHFNSPMLVLIATDSWFNMTPSDTKNFELYKKILPKVYSIVTIEGNHDVHNNNPERVISHVRSFLNNNTKSKL